MTQTVLEYFIPDSPTDGKAILLWVLIAVLVILAIGDIRIYLRYRKTSKRDTTFRKPRTTEQTNTTNAEHEPDIVEIRAKVDEILQSQGL
jgi:cytochrome c-type biogenesis protein CcmH/NrfF